MDTSTETVALRNRILGILQHDGRASYARIAEQLNTPRRQVAHIVQRAIDADEFRITASVSPELLGHERFAYVQIATDGPVAAIRDVLVAMPETSFVAEISGRYSIDAELRVGRDPHLRDTIERIRALPHVRDMHVHQYESIELNLHSPMRRATPGFTLDAADRALVRHLQVDGRASFRELGDAAGISASGARLRLGRLMRHDAVQVIGVPVRGSQPEVPILGVGIQVAGALTPAVARVRELDPEFLAITIGTYDMIVTLSAENNFALLSVIDQLRSFPEVARVESWANLSILKEQYGAGDQLVAREAGADR
ncbi:Lrp/AsnC family transcriptional regulator [Leucobacter sp. 1207-22]|uniref:Lrp/AsnC family transcriptional regulator n=1 Tax=Leucobacter sp. 1207-22 TaxID=2604456 RepID=UPI004064758F